MSTLKNLSFIFVLALNTGLAFASLKEEVEGIPLSNPQSTSESDVPLKIEKINGVFHFTPSLIDNIIADFHQGLTLKVMAKKYGCSEKSIWRNVLKPHELRRYQKRVKTNGYLEEMEKYTIFSLIDQNPDLTPKYITETLELDVHPHTVRCLLKEQGLLKRKHLTPQQKEDILARLRKGQPRRQIVEELSEIYDNITYSYTS
jgi:hypothetical protein